LLSSGGAAARQQTRSTSRGAATQLGAAATAVPLCMTFSSFGAVVRAGRGGVSRAKLLVQWYARVAIGLPRLVPYYALWRAIVVMPVIPAALYGCLNMDCLSRTFSESAAIFYLAHAGRLLAGWRLAGREGGPTVTPYAAVPPYAVFNIFSAMYGSGCAPPFAYIRVLYAWFCDAGWINVFAPPYAWFSFVLACATPFRCYHVASRSRVLSAPPSGRPASCISAGGMLVDGSGLLALTASRNAAFLPIFC